MKSGKQAPTEPGSLIGTTVLVLFSRGHASIAS
jgi:hypothetical protein